MVKIALDYGFGKQLVASYSYLAKLWRWSWIKRKIWRSMVPYLISCLLVPHLGTFTQRYISIFSWREVAVGYIIICRALETTVGLDVAVKFGDFGSNLLRVIRPAHFVSDEQTLKPYDYNPIIRRPLWPWHYDLCVAQPVLEFAHCRREVAVGRHQVCPASVRLILGKKVLGAWNRK